LRAVDETELAAGTKYRSGGNREETETRQGGDRGNRGNRERKETER
jgi:hypothetical protein